MSSREADGFIKSRLSSLFGRGNNITQSEGESAKPPAVKGRVYKPHCLGLNPPRTMAGTTVPFGLCAVSWQTNAQLPVLPL